MRTPIALALSAVLVACGGSPSEQNDPGWTLKAITWDGVSPCRPNQQPMNQRSSYDNGLTQLVPFTCPNGNPAASSGCTVGTGLPPPNDGPMCEPIMDPSPVGSLCYFTCPGK